MFGNLHAHSKLSDDVINAGDDMLPIVAFRYAHQHGLDFLAISDHHKADDSPHSLGMQPVARTVTAQRKCLIFATSQLLGGHYSEEEKNEGFVDILLKQ